MVTEWAFSPVLVHTVHAKIDNSTKLTWEIAHILHWGLTSPNLYERYNATFQSEI